MNCGPSCELTQTPHFCCRCFSGFPVWWNMDSFPGNGYPVDSTSEIFRIVVPASSYHHHDFDVFFSWRTLYFNFLYTNFKKSGPESVMMSFAANFGDLLEYPE